MENLKQLAPIVVEALQRTLGVAKFCCLLHVCNTYIGGYCSLVGASMLPTIHEGNIALKECVTTRSGRVGSGDVVIVRRPDVPWRLAAKRITAVEGDEVSYLVPKTSDEIKTVVVPKGHVWVEGDNPSSSYDSRMYGPVPYAMVESRLVCVVWPPNDFGLLGRKVLKAPESETLS